jgi:hypothetical protein
MLQEIRVVRQNLRRNSYLNAGSQSRDSRKKVKRSGQMNLSKIRSKAQRLIYGRITKST